MRKCQKHDIETGITGQKRKRKKEDRKTMKPEHGKRGKTRKRGKAAETKGERFKRETLR